jgi:acetoin utilization protein AcuB
MLVRTWMTPDPQTIGSTDTLSTAYERMQGGGFHRLPVVDASGALLGIVTDRDIRQHYGHLASTRVDAAMTDRVITIGPGDPIEDAAGLMMREKIGGLPVVANDGALVGIITTSDLVQGLCRCLVGDTKASGRIDFEVAAVNKPLAELVDAIEDRGGAILGLGTLHESEWGSGKGIYYMRILGQDMMPFAERLAQQGCTILATYPAGSGR